MPLKFYFTRQSLRLTPVTGRERQIDEVDEYPNLIDHIRRDHVAFTKLPGLSANGAYTPRDLILRFPIRRDEVATAVAFLSFPKPIQTPSVNS